MTLNLLPVLGTRILWISLFHIESFLTAGMLFFTVSSGNQTFFYVLFFSVSRGDQTLLLPMKLSEELNPSAILYGTILPCVAYFAVKKLIVDPYVRRQEQE